MASVKMILVCNDRKCSKEIHDVGFITKCSHIFCEEHGRMLKRNWENAKCPACKHNFYGSHSIQETKFNQNKELKVTDFLATSPERIFEMAARTAVFWLNQHSEEIRFHRRQSEFLKEKLREVVMISEKHKRIYEAEINKLKTKLEDQRAKMKQLTAKYFLSQNHRGHEFPEMPPPLETSFVRKNMEIFENNVEHLNKKLEDAHDEIRQLKSELLRRNDQLNDFERRDNYNLGSQVKKKMYMDTNKDFYEAGLKKLAKQLNEANDKIRRLSNPRYNYSPNFGQQQMSTSYRSSS